ncbi:hypothetical protein [Clostridium diolis]|uniref:Uncharacterized protein n=1 Tax=Clostridium diolis TaxID=223919 RepID=A0AAV3W558_9CLOT|nr:hypothetical protein [Clostridium diolis]QES71607.1 hypothetical protein F3K33_01720 [Clostridium diolis]GEA33610.1 hypothetical protein CDIOL_45330 [Clostridium diolis]
MIYFPDQEEPITLTREEYPDLPFKKVYIRNPHKVREGLAKYYEYMIEKFGDGRISISRK